MSTELGNMPLGSASSSPLTPLSFLERSAYVWRDRPAVQDGDRKWTYAQHHDRVRRLAGALRYRLGLDAGDRVALKQVSILRDYGKTVEIGSGLGAQDQVIDSPPDGLNDGDAVKIADNKSGNKLDNRPQAANAHAKA